MYWVCFFTYIREREPLDIDDIRNNIPVNLIRYNSKNGEKIYWLIHLPL